MFLQRVDIHTQAHIFALPVVLGRCCIFLLPELPGVPQFDGREQSVLQSDANRRLHGIRVPVATRKFEDRVGYIQTDNHALIDGCIHATGRRFDRLGLNSMRNRLLRLHRHRFSKYLG